MGSPFQRSFSGKSPLNKHGKIQKKIEKARKKDGDNPDFYETYSHLYDAKAKAEAAHSDKNQDKSQDRRIVEEERDNSRADASMSRKASPLNDKKSRLEKKGKRLFDKATSSGSFNQEAYDNNEGIKFDNNKAQRQYTRGSKAFEKAKKENKNK